MEKQLLKRVKPENASRELTRIVETVTCLECCKLYILPETAICGHTLCHGCWIGRQTCPVCALPLKRRTLKANAAIKKYTESVQKTIAAFEKTFNVKMEEFEAEPSCQAVNKIAEKDATKNVNAWLCDSQNQFSAPLSSQLSTQADSPTVEVKTCKIQVHTDSKKPASSVKVVHAPPPVQDDWDKIECVPDTEEFGKNKENVGPMDFEPFSLDDEEYTMDHPRRSSRKRELHPENKPRDASVDKHSSSNISSDTDKLSKIKQNWSNVKKMRKEFGKLHKKKNKSKLNVSIEMCKKSKSAISKPSSSVQPESQKIITIDDFTPDVNQDEKDTLPAPDKITMNTDNVDDKVNNKSEDNNKNGIKNDHNQDSQIVLPMNINQGDEVKSHHSQLSTSLLTNFKDITYPQKDQGPDIPEKVTTSSNIPFIKKSALQINEAIHSNNDSVSTTTTKKLQETAAQTVNHVVNDNIETDSDDIQITIKIGSTLTNILIKKKKSDVNVKLNTDQGVQTSQCMEKSEKSTSCHASPCVPQNLDVQNIEINIGGEGVVSAVTHQTNCAEASTATSKTNLDKTVLTKKNTASDETVTVDISPSLEKELSKIMGEDDTQKDKPQKITQKKPTDKIAALVASNKELNTEDLEIDEDIFASGSVKEGNVQLLKATKPAPSEVLMPTLRQNIKQTQTQRQADKRNRENEEEASSNKKLKVSDVYENSMDDVPIEEHKDESSVNYDSVMGQVFASIDADMGHANKSQGIIADDQNKTIVNKNTDTTQHSQFLKTQKTQRKVLGLSKMGNASQNVKSNLQPKDSESLFALSNVESQALTEKGHNQKPGPETQAHIESLLTPGMCEDLAASPQPDDARATRDRDDSDTSVCEETPQKSSFTRKSNAGSNNPQKPSTQQSQLHPAEAQLIKDIINISDTDTTKVDNVSTLAKPKLTLETPTINQFCKSVQHNSTPMARKSLNFATEQPAGPSNKNTQEVFPRPRTPQAVPRFVVAASCLAAPEVRAVEALCCRKNWTFVKEYSADLTHLVVGVDEEGRSQRTVKFMCALAAGKWIVRFEWAETWMKRGAAQEERFEALDWTGEPGPMRARTAATKLFAGFTFYCMPPFTVLSAPQISAMLESAGGRVVKEPRDVCVTGDDVRLLLAEPEHTQENRFTYLALELNIVPVNYEWALNCLGSYSLSSIMELMLCPASLLPKPAAAWPAAIIADAHDDE